MLAAVRSRIRPPAATGTFFRLVLLLKGADSLVQALGALVLVVVPPAVLAGRANAVVTRDLVGDGDGGWAHSLSRAARELADGDPRAFAVLYLLGHGLVKLVLVVAMLRRVVAAYPVAILVLGACLVFEVVRATRTGSMGLVALSAFDAVVLALVVHQFRGLWAERVRRR